MEWIKRAAPSVALVFASAALVILASETLLRATPFSGVLPSRGMPDFYYENDPDSAYDIAKNYPASTHRFRDGAYEIWSNELRCFDTPYKGETPYLYLAGDSFAWGYAPFERKWGTLLERELGIRTLKCGVPGTGTRQAYAKAQRTLAALPPPAAIVLSYFVNDAADDAAFPNSAVYDGQLIRNLSPTQLSYDELLKRLPYLAELGRKYGMWNEPERPLVQRVKWFLRQHSILYVLAVGAVKDMLPGQFLQTVGVVNAEPAPLQYAPEQSMEEHLARLGDFKRLSEMLGAHFFVVFVPPKESVSGTRAFDPYQRVKEYLRTVGVAYLDPTDTFRQEQAGGAELYWRRDIHFNEAGNEVFAREVAQFLQERGIR